MARCKHELIVEQCDACMNPQWKNRTTPDPLLHARLVEEPALDWSVELYR